MAVGPLESDDRIFWGGRKMRTQEECLTRRQEIRDELQKDLPPKIEQALQAQEELLTWILQGDTLPEEYIIEGRLKMKGAVFEKVVLAGVDGAGSVYPADFAEESGEYILARRPSPQEFEEQK